jgi:hypothetical protein
MDKKLILGASFSHRHLKFLDIDPFSALKEYQKLNFPWIRLGCYWDEIEKEQGKFNFDVIEKLIKQAQILGLNIVLTIGMKAPRYPEYYFPQWLKGELKLHKTQKLGVGMKVLESAVTKYLTNTVKRLKKYSAIKVWQVENEPLDPSGPNSWRISAELLEKEVKRIKSLDSRPILVNLWGNELGIRKLYLTAERLADIIGLDVYFRVPVPFFWRFNRYIGPIDSDEKIKKIIKKSQKPVWLAELQGEPWEPNEIITTKKDPPSCLPKHIYQNYQRVKNWGLEGIILWGFEWWLARKIAGDDRWWKQALNLFKNR